MTTLHLIDKNLPYLNVEENVASAKDLLAQYKLTHLPVIKKKKYWGLLSEEFLLDIHNSNQKISDFSGELILAMIPYNQHFLRAVPITKRYKTNIIPVVNEHQEFLGSISALDLLNTTGNFCGADEGGALIVLEMDRNQLSVSEINGIVESEGATIMHLNIEQEDPSALLKVTLQINKKEISTIIATFERYEFSVLFYSGEELFENEISANYQNLMNYLDI